MAFDFYQELADLGAKTSIEVHTPTPAAQARAADYEKRRRRRHILDSRFNLDENHPDACQEREWCRDMWKKLTRAKRRQLQHLINDGLTDYDTAKIYEIDDYWASDPEIQELERAYAFGDGSWMAYTPVLHPCRNKAMEEKLWKAFQN